MALIRRAAGVVLCCCLVAAGCAPRPCHPGEIGPEPLPIEPPSQQAIRTAIDRGVAFLVQNQNSNGSWGTSRDRGRDIITPVPGGHRAFQAGATALCVTALGEAGTGRPGADEARRRGEDWLIRNLPYVRICSLGVMYNHWGHAYGIQALVRALRHPMSAEREKQIREVIRDQIARLARYQLLDGGWGYYSWGQMPVRSSTDSTTFTTATILIALHEAREVGFDVPRKTADAAFHSLREERRPDFAYPYYYGAATRMPGAPLNKRPASLGRSQVCNVAMRLWGDEKTTDAVIRNWLNRLFARNGWLSMARKQNWPHDSYFRIAAYFYYYGHYYASVCIDLLPPEDRPYYHNYLAHFLLPKQEKEGSWWDFPLYNYHRQYGTAFAVMALQRCLWPPEPPAEPTQR